MGGCRCSYKNCANTTKTRENLHFFHYPVKQKERCRQWIENATKPQFYDLDEDQLRNKVVCETHFEDCYFPNEQKKRLLQGAIPTLDGDCEVKLPATDRTMKIQDVQVLPANADGTIFVLETQNNFNSEKVESYIYTNNGLVLPINKCNDNVETLNTSMSTIYSGSEIDEIEAPFLRNKHPQPLDSLPHESKDFDTYVYESDVTQEDLQRHRLKPLRQGRMEKKIPSVAKITDDIFSRSLGNKYVKKIKQHSKDIAILKRMLKSKSRSSRRPNNATIVNTLKKQISPSLLSVVNLNLNSLCELSPEDLEFFSTIYSTSPQVYQVLCQKYKWKLPNPEAFNTATTNKNNGHVYCEDN